MVVDSSRLFIEALQLESYLFSPNCLNIQPKLNSNERGPFSDWGLSLYSQTKHFSIVDMVKEERFKVIQQTN